MPLVDEPPAPQEQEHIAYVDIPSTFKPVDIAVIKSILESEGIPFYFQGEHFMQVSPWVLPGKLLVAKEGAENAREPLGELKLSIGPINLPEDSGVDVET